jgi:ADP-heptose:LPS heptosyltransferase
VAVLITNDNAILHLADAVKVPHIISVFGPTDPKRIAPRNGRNLYVSPKVDCAPCIELDAGDDSKMCLKEECLGSISINEPCEALRRFIGEPVEV